MSRSHFHSRSHCDAKPFDDEPYAPFHTSQTIKLKSEIEVETWTEMDWVSIQGILPRDGDGSCCKCRDGLPTSCTWDKTDKTCWKIRSFLDKFCDILPSFIKERFTTRREPLSLPSKHNLNTTGEDTLQNRSWSWFTYRIGSCTMWPRFGSILFAGPRRRCLNKLYLGVTVKVAAMLQHIWHRSITETEFVFMLCKLISSDWMCLIFFVFAFVCSTWGIKSNLSKKLLEKTPEMKWWMPSYLGGSFQHAID